MARYLAGVWLNESGNRFRKYERGDDTVKVPGLFTVEAETVEAALEAVFTVGNKMAPDANGRAYPPEYRSLSVGDLVVVSGRGWWVCESFGWRKLESEALEEARS